MFQVKDKDFVHKFPCSGDSVHYAIATKQQLYDLERFFTDSATCSVFSIDSTFDFGIFFVIIAPVRLPTMSARISLLAASCALNLFNISLLMIAAEQMNCCCRFGFWYFFCYKYLFLKQRVQPLSIQSRKRMIMVIFSKHC
jgi:hypothetical protein